MTPLQWALLDPITKTAKALLHNHDAFMAGQPCDEAIEKRLSSAACFAAAAYDAAPMEDAAPAALTRAFLLALIDPLHPDLDYLRADPEAGAKARESTTKLIGIDLSSSPDQTVVEMRNPPAAWLSVIEERQRHIHGEGWTHSHDDRHAGGELAKAAACYACIGWGGHRESILVSETWPWAADWWKPTDRRRNLVKAGALILAEIERLDRAAAARGDDNG